MFSASRLVRPVLHARAQVARGSCASRWTVGARIPGGFVPKTYPRTFASSSSSGPAQTTISWRGLLLSAALGAGLVLYFEHEKQKALEDRQQVVAGSAEIATDFDLVDHTGQRRTLQDYHGQYKLVYFGFTFCPEICPMLLAKLGRAVDRLDKTRSIGPIIQPFFISVDPKRDSPKQMEAYLRDFSPRILGLTGTAEEIEKVAGGFRAYYSKPEEDEGDDYVLDHAMYMFLLDKDGRFVEVLNSEYTDVELADKIAQLITAREAR